MPYRPPPDDFATWANDIRRRLEAKEREILTLPEGAKPLLAFENGAPLGDTRFLDFGTGIQATLIGDDYVRVTADAGTPEFDAIVDASLSASDPKNRLFLGIGEALTYLAVTVGLLRAAVLVRDGVYTETANWTNPTSVLLFGVNGPGAGGVAIGLPTWNHGGFSGTGAGWRISNLKVRLGAKVNGFLTDGGSYLLAESCEFDSSGMTGTPQMYGAFAHYIHCRFTRMINLGSHVFVTKAQVDMNTKTDTVLLADLAFIGDMEIFVSANATWNLPKRTRLTVASSNAINSLGGAGTGHITLTQANLASVSYVHSIPGRDDDLQQFSLWVTASPRVLQAYGQFNTVSAVAPQAPATTSAVPHQIDVTVERWIAVVGPAVLDVGMCRPYDATGGLGVQLNGKGITGRITVHSTNMSSGTFLTYVGCSQSVVSVAINEGTLSGTAKSYSFDATSNDNFLIFEKTSLFPVAGTDAGLRNVVLPNSLTTINGHVIEDEGVGLTQRANMNFVGAGVTATDAGGKTVVTIPGGGGSGGDEPSAAGWMGL